MRSREAFRALITEKEKAYYAARRVRRKRLLYTAVPTACAVLCCILALSRLQTHDGIPEKEDLLTCAVSLSICEESFYTPDTRVYVYTEAERIASLAALLEDLTPDEERTAEQETVCLKDECAPVQEDTASPEPRYHIEVDYSSGISVTYTVWGCQFLQVNDGEVLRISEKKTEELAVLIGNLPK